MARQARTAQVARRGVAAQEQRILSGVYTMAYAATLAGSGERDVRRGRECGSSKDQAHQQRERYNAAHRLHTSENESAQAPPDPCLVLPQLPAYAQLSRQWARRRWALCEEASAWNRRSELCVRCVLHSSWVLAASHALLRTRARTPAEPKNATVTADADAPIGRSVLAHVRHEVQPPGHARVSTPASPIALAAARNEAACPFLTSFTRASCTPARPQDRRSRSPGTGCRGVS